MVSHGHWPPELLNYTVVSIPKDSRGSLSNSENYRGIALSNCICKIIDTVLLKKYFLATSSLQFAFKKHHSTVLCTAVLLETVGYFKERNCNVYSCLLDASKAFDRINHGKRFRLLLHRGMPPIIVRFLINCYVNQSISVTWNKHRSESFGCLNGVKQGGVLSPILFTIDELLLLKLRSSGYGCYIDDTFVGALGYPDTLLSPSIRGLKQMVHISETFAIE